MLRKAESSTPLRVVFRISPKGLLPQGCQDELLFKAIEGERR